MRTEEMVNPRTDLDAKAEIDFEKAAKAAKKAKGAKTETAAEEGNEPVPVPVKQKEIVKPAKAKEEPPSKILDAVNAKIKAAEKEKREPQLLPPFSCHNLRHTFCTRLCENETNLKIIQDIMGHKDISTTMEIYAEATKEAKAHSFANLNGKLGISV